MRHSINRIFTTNTEDVDEIVMKEIDRIALNSLSSVTFSLSLSMDWYFRFNQASLFHLTRISLSFTVISLKPIFILFDL